MLSILFLILFFKFYACNELFSYPQGWTFNYNQHQVCKVYLEQRQIKVNLTNIYDLQSEQLFKIPTLPDYCAPQACYPLNNSIGFLCRDYTDYKFKLYDSLTQNVTILKFDGQFARYDAARNTLGIWNFRTIRIFQLNKNGTLGSQLWKNRPDLHPTKRPSDFHIFNNTVYFLINGIIYELTTKEGQLKQKFYTGLLTFPFQFLQTNSLQFSRPIRSTSPANMDQFFSNLAFPFLSLVEFGILMGIAYWCKCKIYRTRDGRLGIRPQTSESASNDSQPFHVPFEDKTSVQKT